MVAEHRRHLRPVRTGKSGPAATLTRMEASRATHRRPPPTGRAFAVFAVGLAGAALLVAAEFSTIASVDLPLHTCREIADVRALDRCSLDGLERHGGAFLLLGAAAALMAVGASVGRSRPAGVALIVIAGAVAIMSTRDLVAAHETGVVGLTYEGARGRPGSGLYLEFAAGILLAAVGTVALWHPVQAGPVQSATADD